MLDVSMGYAHSLAIVKYNNPGKKALAKLKVFDPKEVGGDSSEDSGGSTRKRDNKDDDGAPKKKSKKA